MESDLALLQRYARDGDSQAMRLLVQRHQEKVYAICLRRLKSEADARDATQEVFLSLMQNAGGIHTHLAAWLHRCARNAAISMIRESQLRQRHEIQRAWIQRHEGDADPVMKERLGILESCLRQLEPADQHLVIRNHLEGSSQQELATDMGVSQQAVAKRIKKALGQLRQSLSSHGIVFSFAAAVVFFTKRGAAAATRAVASAISTASTPAVTIKAGTTAAAIVLVALVSYQDTGHKPAIGSRVMASGRTSAVRGAAATNAPAVVPVAPSLPAMAFIQNSQTPSTVMTAPSYASASAGAAASDQLFVNRAASVSNLQQGVVSAPVPHEEVERRGWGVPADLEAPSVRAAAKSLPAVGAHAGPAAALSGDAAHPGQAGLHHMHHGGGYGEAVEMLALPPLPGMPLNVHLAMAGKPDFDGKVAMAFGDAYVDKAMPLISPTVGDYMAILPSGPAFGVDGDGPGFVGGSDTGYGVAFSSATDFVPPPEMMFGSVMAPPPAMGTFTFFATAVPEPASVLVLLPGMALLLRRRRR